MEKIINKIGEGLDYINRDTIIKKFKKLGKFTILCGALYTGYKIGVKKTNADRDIELTIILNKYPDLMERFEEAASDIKMIKRG